MVNHKWMKAVASKFENVLIPIHCNFVMMVETSALLVGLVSCMRKQKVTEPILFVSHQLE